MSNEFDPYYNWLGISPDEQPADHYRLLGIRQFEANPEVISNASDQRMGHIRTFQTGKRAAESQRILNELSAATRCLLDPEQKKKYDLQLKAQLAAKKPVATKAAPVAVARPVAAKAVAPRVAAVTPIAVAPQVAPIITVEQPAFTTATPAEKVEKKKKKQLDTTLLLLGAAVFIGIAVVVAGGMHCDYNATCIARDHGESPTTSLAYSRVDRKNRRDNHGRGCNQG